MASFVDPNDFGAYVISILPLTLAFLNKKLSHKKKIILAVICLLAAFCLFKTFSRGAWIGFFVGATVYFFIYNKKSVLVIPLIIIIFLITPLGFNRVASLFKPEKNTVWERTQLWQAAGNMIKERPFLGLGVNTFSKYFPKYKPADYPDMRYAHNSYLQMAAETGISGLLIFICIPITVLAKAFRGIRKKFRATNEGFALMGAIAGYLGLLVHSFFDNNLFSLMLTTLFWVLTAYITSLNKLLSSEPYAKR
jgi:putative inorganic carbon (HCO3(-)) transporter